MRVVPVFTLLAAAAFAPADESVRLVDKSGPGSQFRVVTESTISGELLAPVAKDKPPERIKISGKSSIDYVERVLPVDAKDADFKSLRVYETIAFRKTAGDRTDATTLRPEVRRLVFMKKGPAKVPFSPDGPLLWGEIELLRTDMVVPALGGLLPDKPVAPGDTWKASTAAVTELTDLEKLDSGELICTLDRVIASGPRKVAQVSFAGTLTGVNEDGPTRQKLSGKLQVDLTAQCITFLKVDGEHDLLDADRKNAGRITGTFELTRTPAPRHPALAEAVINGLDLNPSAENTKLLYHTPEGGVRFVHPRNWRVVRTTGRQITLDESEGAGLLITLDTADGVPSAARYLREALKELHDRGAKVLDRTAPGRVADGVERFTIDAQFGTEKVLMVYFVVRQEKGAATLAARVPDRFRDVRLKELDGLVRSFAVVRRLDGK
jgi:hypothetical protein